MEDAALWVGQFFAILSRLRFTLLFLLAMITANFLAGNFSDDLSLDVLDDWGVGQDSVWAGDLTRLLTGTFLSHDIDMLIRQIIFASVVIGYTEWNWGSIRAAITFFALDIGSTLLLLTAVWVLPSLADVAALNDVGMSMGGFGLIGFITANLRNRFGFFAFAMLGILVKIYFDFEPLTDTGHLIAICIGFVVGQFLRFNTSR